jgi:hypothetical protein
MSLMFRWDSDCSIRAQESSIYANRGIFPVIIRLVMSAFCNLCLIRISAARSYTNYPTCIIMECLYLPLHFV